MKLDAIFEHIGLTPAEVKAAALNATRARKPVVIVKPADKRPTCIVCHRRINARYCVPHIVALLLIATLSASCWTMTKEQEQRIRSSGQWGIHYNDTQ
jgi:hypothetical protein